MKQQKIKHAILFCLLVAIWGTLAASLFGSCTKAAPCSRKKHLSSHPFLPLSDAV